MELLEKFKEIYQQHGKEGLLPQNLPDEVFERIKPETVQHDESKAIEDLENSIKEMDEQLQCFVYLVKQFSSKRDLSNRYIANKMSLLLLKYEAERIGRIKGVKILVSPTLENILEGDEKYKNKLLKEINKYLNM